MFHSRTLFVVGAGASCEAGLPTGDQLKMIIRRKLDPRSGDEQIRRALHMHARHYNAEHRDKNITDQLLEAADSIQAAMPQVLSIDNYLDAHHGNSDIELVGKIAIAKAILEAESKSHMYFHPTREKGPPNDAFYNDWHNRFFQALTERVSKDKLEDVFDHVSFINFNHDRCIEHFLAFSFRNVYRVTEETSRQIVGRLKIFHPYGVVGKLGWGGFDRDKVYFGGWEDKDLLKIAGTLRTFNESFHDEEEVLRAMRFEVEKAEVIVFLGFAFHPQNMDLIRPEQPSAVKRVFATARGISESDCKVISRGLFSFARRKEDFPVEIRSMNCKDLFEEYWRSLTRL